MSPRWGSTSRQTDWPTVSRKLTWPDLEPVWTLWSREKSIASAVNPCRPARNPSSYRLSYTSWYSNWSHVIPGKFILVFVGPLTSTQHEGRVRKYSGLKQNSSEFCRNSSVHKLDTWQNTSVFFRLCFFVLLHRIVLYVPTYADGTKWGYNS
jgi:hypothetical protein